MTPKDHFFSVTSAVALNSANIATATVTNGAAINISGILDVAIVLNAAIVAGTIAIQDIQFADDSGFTTNVSTYNASNAIFAIKANDRFSSIEAFAQTLLSQSGSTKIGITNNALETQKFMRARFVTVGGSVNITPNAQYLLHHFGELPVVQS